MTVSIPRSARAGILVALGLSFAGCVSSDDIARYSAPKAGFDEVQAQTAAATEGKDTVWIQNKDEAQQINRRVEQLVVNKTIGADTAVQVALLNNRGLQAAYADIGLSAADVWQQTMLENPKVSIGVFGIASPELGLYRTIEGMIAQNALALVTQKRRVDIAETQWHQAQLRAVNETLRVANEARRAWINAVAAFETTVYLNQAKVAADAASELAHRLGESGALGKAGQAREHAFYAELTGQMAQARLTARLAKEELTRAMGLWGAQVQYKVPDFLPPLPRKLMRKDDIEREALRARGDLQLAKLELDLVAKSYGLSEATRYLTDLEIIGGFEIEREIETEYELDGGNLTETKSRKTVVTPQIELEFVIPIFDSGKARMRKAELAHMQAANRLAETAVNIRSQARSAYTAYRATYDIARHYRDAVVPLRKTIQDEALLTYNGMITNTFELLADTRSKINTILLSASAKRDFWLADAGLTAAIHGGGAGSAAAGESARSVTAAAPAAH